LTEDGAGYIMWVMKAEIISIGTELLLGHIINTNAAFIAERLAGIGVDVYHQVTVGDNVPRLADAIRQAAGRADIVITSGGLGPTVDDVTVEALTKVIKKKLVLDKAVLDDMKEVFALRGSKVPPDSVRQAYVPAGSTIIRNPRGTAPGIISEFRKRLVICLPGPPRELEAMLDEIIKQIIQKKYGKWVLRSRTVKISGLAESQVNNTVQDLLRLKPPTTVGIYAKIGEVDLKIMAKSRTDADARTAIYRIEQKIRKRLKKHVFGCDEETLEGSVVARLIRKGMTLAIAESCTGGLLSSRITDVPGSSKCLLSGFVMYSNKSKGELLGVRRGAIKEFGAVSEPVARQMAEGISKKTKSDVGIGITGIAGPSGGTPSKPVGLVYIAMTGSRKTVVKKYAFRGSRTEIKFQATQAALDMIRLSL